MFQIKSRVQSVTPFIGKLNSDEHVSIWWHRGRIYLFHHFTGRPFEYEKHISNSLSPIIYQSKPCPPTPLLDFSIYFPLNIFPHDYVTNWFIYSTRHWIVAVGQVTDKVQVLDLSACFCPFIRFSFVYPIRQSVMCVENSENLNR